MKMETISTRNGLKDYWVQLAGRDRLQVSPGEEVFTCLIDEFFSST